jgi:hypothetical protein
MEEDSNISAMSVNDDDSKIEAEAEASTSIKKAEVLMKTLEIKLVDCCLQEKVEKPVEEIKVETSMDVDDEPADDVQIVEDKIEILHEEPPKHEEQFEVIKIEEDLIDVKQEVVEIDAPKIEQPAAEEPIKIEIIDEPDKPKPEQPPQIAVEPEIKPPEEPQAPQVKEEIMSEELKLELQESFEEVSFLRRSRRLKSIYSETPPVNSDCSASASKDHSINVTPEVIQKFKSSFKKLTETDGDHQHDDRKAIPPKSEQIEPKSEAPFENPVPIDKALTIQDLQCDPRLSQFVTIKDNIYIKSSDKVICKVNKTMKCDCTITEEDLKNGEMGCRYNCINRLLFIECSSKCRCGEFCDNQQFQRYNYAPVNVIRTEKKGYGIRAEDDIPAETFIIEYVGEVLNNKQFEKRAKKYSKDKNRHYYFMALRSNAVIDATSKGNISRFINHSCDPNAMTQKWTGELW